MQSSAESLTVELSETESFEVGSAFFAEINGHSLMAQFQLQLTSSEVQMDHDHGSLRMVAVFGVKSSLKYINAREPLRMRITGIDCRIEHGNKRFIAPFTDIGGRCGTLKLPYSVPPEDEMLVTLETDSGPVTLQAIVRECTANKDISATFSAFVFLEPLARLDSGKWNAFLKQQVAI